MDAANVRPGDVLQPGNKTVTAVLLEPGSVTIICGDYDLNADDYTFADSDAKVEFDNNWPKSGREEPLIRVESGTTMFAMDGRLDGSILVWVGDDDSGYPLYAPIDNPTMIYDCRNERIFEYTVLDIKEES